VRETKLEQGETSMSDEKRPKAEDIHAEKLPYPAKQSDMRQQPDSDLSNYRAAGKLKNKSRLSPAQTAASGAESQSLLQWRKRAWRFSTTRTMKTLMKRSAWLKRAAANALCLNTTCVIHQPAARVSRKPFKHSAA
jgi:hypothetical protein